MMRPSKGKRCLSLWPGRLPVSTEVMASVALAAPVELAGPADLAASAELDMDRAPCSETITGPRRNLRGPIDDGLRLARLQVSGVEPDAGRDVAVRHVVADVVDVSL